LPHKDTVFDQLNDCSAADASLFQVFVGHLQPADGIEDNPFFELKAGAAGAGGGSGDIADGG